MIVPAARQSEMIPLVGVKLKKKQKKNRSYLCIFIW